MKKAVALKYSENIGVPVVVAKGNGLVAEKILSEAEKNLIPIKEDSVLVDMLGLSELGESVPENTWEALAKVFSFILEFK